MITDSELNKISKSLWIIIGLTIILILDIVDYMTGPVVAFSLFYLIPVSAAAWYAGSLAGLIMSVMSASTWLITEYLSGRILPSSEIYHYWEAFTRVTFFVIVSLLFSQLKKNLIHESHLARTDNLTDTANLMHFVELLQAEIIRFNRYGQPFTVVYLDLDNFKVINDTAGHIEGNRALKTVAVVMKEQLRETDTVARLGGDEFAIFMPQTSQISARTLVERLRHKMITTMNENGWPLTFSIGVLTCVSTPPSVNELIKRADTLMYSVKKSGKDGIAYSLYTEDQDSR